MISYFTVQFLVFVSLNSLLSFSSFILMDADYFNVPEDKIGSTLGDLGVIVEAFVIIVTPLVGLLFDSIGRRVPVVLGMMMVSAGFGLIPFG